MATGNIYSVKIFYSYAHEDETLRDELARHLGKINISGWHDRKIIPGKNWEEEIDYNLEIADIILLLISADFMNSDYCMGKEMKRALERHVAKEACVIPIILRSTYWENAPFSHIQALPTGAKAVMDSRNRDKAFADIAKGVHRAIENMLRSRCIADAVAYSNTDRYEEAYGAYRQALDFSRHDADRPDLYKDLGDILQKLGRFDKAGDFYDQAISFQPGNVQFYLSKGDALSRSDRFE